MLSDLKLLLVGCGKMGSAMLDGWINGGVEPHNVDIVDPYLDKSLVLGKCENVFKSHDELDKQEYDIVFLAVKPQAFKEVVSNYNIIASQNTVFVSVAAGINILTMKECLGNKARVIRAMPNLPATIKEGVTGIYADEKVEHALIKNVKELLICNGEVIEASNEEGIDKITAISGSGPAYIFHFIESMQQIASEYGFTEEDAKKLATQTVYGAAKLAHGADISASELRQNVTSPKGTTEAALNILMDEKSGLKQLLKKSIDNAKQRAKELSS